ncbi:MAG: hypothetical protein BWK73_16635 [Thiothrix lacustris]|uniref:Uncharacterized protein n=1 Tax=Thiothrix lacustris TaxID=525917 RepID=A0A1Y1QR29_9GAMM|nr:MAG: hypothetical protein BWK73_16635 [Thiothrix lacustris]
MLVVPEELVVLVSVLLPVLVEVFVPVLLDVLLVVALDVLLPVVLEAFVPVAVEVFVPFSVLVVFAVEVTVPTLMVLLLLAKLWYWLSVTVDGETIRPSVSNEPRDQPLPPEYEPPPMSLIIPISRNTVLPRKADKSMERKAPRTAAETSSCSIKERFPPP